MLNLLAGVQLNQISPPPGIVEPSTEDIFATGTSLETIASVIFGFLTTIAGIAFLLWFVIGGLNWLTAGGDEKRVEQAKNQMTNAAVGLVIVVAAYAIANIIQLILGISILTPGTVIRNLTFH